MGTNKRPVLFLSARTSLSVPAAVARSSGPLAPNNTERTVWDFTPKASAVPLQPPLGRRSEVSSWSSFLLPLSVFCVSSTDPKGLGPSLGLCCGHQVWPYGKRRMRRTGFPVCDREWECDGGKRGLLEARPPHSCLGVAGNLPSLREMLTAPRSKCARLLSCCPWPRRNGTITERGLLRGRRKKGSSPCPSACRQASLGWQPEKLGEWRGLQMLHLIAILLRLKRGRRGWLPAEGWSSLMSLSYLAPGRNESFTRVAGAQGRISPGAAVLQRAPRLPPPIFSIFSSVGSR